MKTKKQNTEATGHTPGPLVIDKTCIYFKNSGDIAGYINWEIDEPARYIFNRLNNTAPDLLAACKGAFEFIDSLPGTDEELLEQLYNAIAKAEGKGE